MYYERHEGTPQGGPLSPILSNLLLDDLDRELEKRGHTFCRYADDCNIYVQSEVAGERVKESITQFLEKKLKLRVNQTKSAVAPVKERQFLGYRIMQDGRLILAPRSIERIKERIRKLTKRTRGVKLETVIKEINQTLIGWGNYFCYVLNSDLQDLDGWIRRRVRCYRLKQRKRGHSILSFLTKLGVPREHARSTSGSNKGWWRLSSTPAIHEALNLKWFRSIGLISLVDKHKVLNV